MNSVGFGVVIKTGVRLIETRVVFEYKPCLNMPIRFTRLIETRVVFE